MFQLAVVLIHAYAHAFCPCQVVDSFRVQPPRFVALNIVAARLSLRSVACSVKLVTLSAQSVKQQIGVCWKLQQTADECSTRTVSCVADLCATVTVWR